MDSSADPLSPGRRPPPGLPGGWPPWGPRVPAEEATLAEAAARQRAEREPPTSAPDRDGSSLPTVGGEAPGLPHLTDDSNEFPDDPEPAAALLDGKYTLEEEIGRGGMGTVWRARQWRPARRWVAIKFVQAGFDNRAVLRRFDAERQALALMDHPCIARIFDGGATPEGLPYFVMEYVDGQPIVRYCDERRLDLADRLDLFAKVADAVHHAHQKGVLHRDLKPSNVLVADADGRPSPKVIDFGLAKAAGKHLSEQSLSESGLVVGTPNYMSPEQADPDRGDADTRSDVYSLGVILYELLAGAPPVDVRGLPPGAWLGTLQLLHGQEMPRPSERAAAHDDLPSLASRRGCTPRRLLRMLAEDLDWIVLKAIEFDRDRRYDSASALAADIRRALAGDAVTARPPNAAYRLGKFFRRHRASTIFSVLLAFALAAGALGTAMGWIAAAREHAEAIEARLSRMEQAAAAAAANRRATSAEAAAAASSRHAIEEGKLARLAEGDSQALARFLTARVLGAARPLGSTDGLGLDVRLSDALVAAEPHLEADFRGHPLAEAAARHALGVTWRNLGKYAAAESQLRRAAELRDAALPHNHPDLLLSRASIAEVARLAGRPEAAVRLLEELAPDAEAVFGHDHPAVLSLLHNLGSAYSACGQHKLALAVFRDVMERRGHSGGADSPETLASSFAYAGALRRAGRPVEALGLQVDILRRREKLLGALHPATVATRVGLAAAYVDALQPEKAAALAESALAALESRLGERHPEVLAARSLLAVALREAARPAEALPLCERNCQLAPAVLGAEHPDVLVHQSNLGRCLCALKRPAEALPLLDDCLRKCLRQCGPDHPDTALAQANLAFALRGLGRLDEAQSLLEAAARHAGPSQRAWIQPAALEVLAVGDAADCATAAELAEGMAKAARAAAAEGRPVGPAARTMGQVGRAFLFADRPAEAEVFLREALRWLDNGPAEALEPWRRDYLRGLMGAALLRQGQHAAAEPLLRSAAGALRMNPTPASSRHRSDLLHWLAEWCDQAFQPAEAAVLREEASKLARFAAQ